MNQIMEITAEVLEKVASYVASLEEDRQTVQTQERQKVAEELKTKLRTLTGEDVEENLINKLAASDQDVVNLFNKVAESLQTPDSLGGPSGAEMSRGPLNTKEEVKLAEDRFLTWLTN